MKGTERPCSSNGVGSARPECRPAEANLARLAFVWQQPVDGIFPRSRKYGLTGGSFDLIFISMKLETVSRQLEALGNPTRLQIYRTLVRAGPGGLAVGQVQEQVGLPASTLSHHMKRLVDQGLVRQERAGTSLICHAEYRAMSALLRFLVDECCADEACEPSSACAPQTDAR